MLIEKLEQVLLTMQPGYGKCVLRLKRHDAQQGSIIIPESARDAKPDATEILREAEVISVRSSRASRKGRPLDFLLAPGFSSGDRVLVSLRLEDLDRDVIVIRNENVQAVVVH